MECCAIHDKAKEIFKLENNNCNFYAGRLEGLHMSFTTLPCGGAAATVNKHPPSLCRCLLDTLRTPVSGLAALVTFVVTVKHHPNILSLSTNFSVCNCVRASVEK